MLVAAGVAYLPVMQILYGQWMTNDTYSFGILVPMISLYFVWLQWNRVRQLEVSPEPIIGSILIGCCAAILVGGRIIGVIGIQEAALVLTVPSLIWLLLGRRFVFTLWFPLLYLLLMLPIWEILTDRFHYRFQLFSALLSERLLNLINVPVHRHATYLELPSVTLEVASVCSGVNFLLAVVAIGVPQAYLLLKGWWPRSLVIGFAIAIAILSNGLRIAIIGGLSHYQLSANIHGPGHILQGLFVSSAGLIALQIAIGYLSHRYPKPRYVFDAPQRDRRARRFGWVLVAVARASMMLLVAAKMSPYTVLASSSSGPLSQPNIEAAGWRVINSNHPMPIVVGGREPNIGQQFMLGTRWQVELFMSDLVYPKESGGIGYRSVQVNSRSALSELPVTTASGTVFVNNTSFRAGDRENDVVYWYEVNGAVTSQVTTAKLSAIWNVIVGQRSLPRLIVVTRSRDASANVAEPLAAFVGEVFQILQSQRTAGAAKPGSPLS